MRQMKQGGNASCVSDSVWLRPVWNGEKPFRERKMKSNQSKTDRRNKRRPHGVVKQPGAASIEKMKRLYRKLCESHPDPKVQRIAQGMETALRWATEGTKGWSMKEKPMLLADCLRDDLKAA
jgi:hypothetical protein